MSKNRVQKPKKRLTVISRRREWDAEAFAKTLTAYVFYQLEHRAEQPPQLRQDRQP